MIQLKRIRDASVIAAAFRGPGRIDKLMDLVRSKRTGKVSFNPKVWKAAKEQLKRESSGKCSYCEAPTSVVAPGDVEHFRPKSKYWWLAYCYDNYLYSCLVCNQQFKGDDFHLGGVRLSEPPLPDENLSDEELRAAVALFTPDPLNDSEGLPWMRYFEVVRAEQALLPDPYLIDAELLFKWVADRYEKEVSIAARDGSPESQRAFQVVNAPYGLNRDELKRRRWIVYRDLEAFYELLGVQSLPEAKRQKIVTILREMMSPEAEFAGMVRYFIRDEWHLDLDAM